MPTVDTVKWRADRPSVVVEPLDRGPHRAVVGQRLAHPHEHHVRHPPGQRRPPGPDHLLDDLAGGEMALEAGLAGGAERAGHGAAGLGRHAHRGPVG